LCRGPGWCVSVWSLFEGKASGEKKGGDLSWGKVKKKKPKKTGEMEDMGNMGLQDVDFHDGKGW
jgi:hypothetical protein